MSPSSYGGASPGSSILSRLQITNIFAMDRNGGKSFSAAISIHCRVYTRVVHGFIGTFYISLTV